jgi:hypothetical protein
MRDVSVCRTGWHRRTKRSAEIRFVAQIADRHLGLGAGYAAGVAIDPKTDDLITLTNPDLCAGGYEGRMTVFTKPYKIKTGHSIIVGQNCSGGLRLSADSTKVFILDEDFAGINPIVLQRSFPDGKHLGYYGEGQSISVTTIPNTLPN